MAKMERVREEVSAPPAPDYWKRKTDAGWRLAAVEWIREASAETGSSETRGLAVGHRDCQRARFND